MAPHARARLHVALGAGFSFYVIAAAGLAIWVDNFVVSLGASARF